MRQERAFNGSLLFLAVTVTVSLTAGCDGLVADGG